MIEKDSAKRRGVALFITVLLTMSLSVIALATVARLSETAHTTGKDLQDRRLLAYAYSAVNIVNGELRNLVDSTFECEDAYSISGGMGGSTTTNDGTFRYYPRDISVTSGEKPMFAYRAVARRLTTDAGARMYGINGLNNSTVEFSRDKNACYDVTVDVREVIEVGSANITKDSASDIAGYENSGYSLGKMKTIGLISCFSRDGENRL
jgi:hypothetical protein